MLDKVRIVTGELEGAEALAGVKIFQHIQKELVEKSVLLRGDEKGLGRIIFGLEAVLRVVLLEVEQAACNIGGKCASQEIAHRFMTVFMTVLLLGGIPPIPRQVFQTGMNEKHCMHVMTGGTSPRTTVGPPTGMNEFEKYWRRWKAVRTEKIEDLLLAWMQPVLKHSGFSQRPKFLLLKQNL